MEDDRFAVTLSWQEGYQFAADFGMEGVPDVTLDEPPPLGEGSGPNAARLLAAAIGNCLSASLLYCLKRARFDVADLHTTVEGTMVRNEHGRLRIGGFRVKLAPELPPEQRVRMGRCLDLFEDFCIVTESVRQGIQVDVDVAPAVTPAHHPSESPAAPV